MPACLPASLRAYPYPSLPASLSPYLPNLILDFQTWYLISKLFILQLMTLPDADMNQILNHMGHTWEVHKTYYRHYDSIGERLEVAKLLMLQDQNRLNEYRKKGLTDIDPKLLQQATFRGKVFIKHVRLCKSKILTLRYSVLILGCLLQ